MQIDIKPIANELDPVINSKALEISSPKTIKYAKDTQARLKKVGKIDATTAQEVVQNYNKSLEAFYRNPSYDNASQAAIDAMIVNRMRQSLDEGITKVTGTQYSALKRQYGALKAIEKDVIKASLRDARKNTKGLIDFTDILTGGDITSGLLTLNPVQLSRGLAGRGIKEFYKYLNNPNRAIEKMFQLSDEAYSKIPATRYAANAKANNQTITLKTKDIGRADAKLPTTNRKQIKPIATNKKAITINKSLPTPKPKR